MQISLDQTMTHPVPPIQQSTPQVVFLSKMQTHVLNFFLDKRMPSGEGGSSPLPLLECLKFVFGSVKPHQMVHTWPCNAVPDLAELHQLVCLRGNPEELCNRVLALPIGKCDLQSELFQTVMDQVSLLMDILSSFSSEYNPLLHFFWKTAGSVAENTKTGPPDEFDILMMFNELSKGFKDLDPDHFDLGATGTAELNTLLPGIAEDDEPEAAFWIHLVIFQMQIAFIGKSQNWKHLDLSFIHFKVTKAGFALFVESESINLTVKLDLIPGFWCGQSMRQLYVLSFNHQF